MALVMERAGYNVMGVDIFPAYVDQINKRTFNSAEPRVNEFLQASKNFQATTDFKAACDLVRPALYLGRHAEHRRRPALRLLEAGSCA